jgi:hypothetical protein
MGTRDIIEKLYARTRMIFRKGFSALSYVTFLILFLPVQPAGPSRMESHVLVSRSDTHGHVVHSGDLDVMSCVG